MPEITREQVRIIFNQRYGGQLGSTESEKVFEISSEQYSSLRGPGGDIAEWHFKAFAEIDDTISRKLCHDKKDAIKQVNERYSELGHAHCYDSFEAMYYELKRDKELKYRRRHFAEQLLAGNKEEALEHLYRLLLITDIDSLFGTSE